MKESRNRYEIFLKVAESGNISRASEALNYTQSGISHVIAALERELGLRLFIRGKSGVTLTDQGRRILPHVRALVNHENQLRQAAYEMNHAVAGRLRIGSFSSVSASWMPDMICYFRAHYPKVEIEILDGNYNEIRAWITKGQVDCGFLSSIVAEGLRFHALLEDPLYVVMPAGHPLAEKRSVRLEEALAYPMIIETPGCDNDIQHLLEKAPAAPDIRYSFRDDLIILSFVEKNLGISISQGLVLKGARSSVVARPLSPERRRVIGLAFTETMNSLLPALFLKHMRAYCLSQNRGEAAGALPRGRGREK